MNLTTIVAGILLLAVTSYAILGGADFGAGFWDLTAGGAERGERPRSVIENAIGPVWEANHVWLIFIFVVLWTGFPEAYASITLTLFVPLTLAAVGIVLRGSGFAFRKVALRTRYRRIFGGAFALSSVMVPFAMGAIVGAIASGRVPAGGEAGDPWQSWINPTGILGGVLAVVAVAFLASVYLVVEAHRFGEEDMVNYFRQRAIGSAVLAGAVAASGVFVLRSDAPFLFDGLTSRALPLVIVSTVCGVVTLVLLMQGRRPKLTRMFAIAAVALVVISWGVAQWDYILPETMTLSEAAAPSGTMVALLVAAVFGLLIVAPSFAWLYRLDQQGMLPEEGLSS